MEIREPALRDTVTVNLSLSPRSSWGGLGEVKMTGKNNNNNNVPSHKLNSHGSLPLNIKFIQVTVALNRADQQQAGDCVSQKETSAVGRGTTFLGPTRKATTLMFVRFGFQGSYFCF